MPMKRAALAIAAPLLAALLWMAGPAHADDQPDRLEAGDYECREFAARSGDAAAAQYALVFLHVGVEAIGLPLRPITPEREATILDQVRDLCLADGEADFRVALMRYLRSATFRDWWAKLPA